VYHDHDRTVIPLAVVRGQDHRWVLHAWQIDGTTARGETSVLGKLQPGRDDYDPFRYRERLCQVPQIRCRQIEQPR